MKNKEDIIRIAPLLFSFIFLSIILAMIIHSSITYKEIRAIDMKVNIGDYVGFNLDTSYLEFGTMMPGGYSERTLDIHNDGNIPLRIEIEIIEKKDINYFLGEYEQLPEQWIIISENNFLLKPGEGKSVKFSIKPKEGAEQGNYMAQSIIKMRYSYEK